MGIVRRPRQHSRLWLRPDAVRTRCRWPRELPTPARTKPGAHDRLTQAKEDGASIEIDGKKVALGIPKAQNAASGTSAIPLGRAATPDEAAGAMLL